MSLQIVARQNIPAWRAVTGDGYMADSNNMAHYDKVIGVSVRGAEYPADSLFVALTGSALFCPVWQWTPGLPIYLNGMSLSHTSPDYGFKQIVGIATRVDQMVVQIMCPTTLPAPPMVGVGGDAMMGVGGEPLEEVGG